jgi:hypothetical protein
MDRALDSEEKVKVRTARADFFKIHKRKEPSPQNSLSTPSTRPLSSSTSKRLKTPAMVSSKSSSTPLIIAFYDPEIRAADAHGRTQDQILSWNDSQLERCHNYIQMLFPLPEGSPFNWEAPVIDREVMIAFRSRDELRDGLRKSFERILEFYGFTTSTTPVAEENDDKEDGTDRKSMSTETEEDTAPQSTSDVDPPPTITHAAAPTDTNTTSPDSPSSTTSVSAPKHVPTPYHITRGPNFPRNSRNWAIRSDHNHLRITRILRCLRVLGLQTESDAFFAALKRVFEDPEIRISETSMRFWRRAVERPLCVAPDGEVCGWLKKWEEERETDD